MRKSCTIGKVFAVIGVLVAIAGVAMLVCRFVCRGKKTCCTFDNDDYDFAECCDDENCPCCCCSADDSTSTDDDSTATAFAQEKDFVKD